MAVALSNTPTNSLSTFTVSLPPTASNPLNPPHISSADPPSDYPAPPWTSTASPAHSSLLVSTTTSKSLSSPPRPSSTIQELTREERIARFEEVNKEALKFMDDIPEEDLILYHNDVIIFGMDWQEHAEVVELYK